MLPLDENPAGLIAIEATPLSRAGDRQVLRVVVPTAAGIQRPSSRGACGSRGWGSRRRRPCSTTPTCSSCRWERWATEISARSPEPRQNENTKRKVDLGLEWRSCLSGPILSCKKICARFLASGDMALRADSIGRSSSIGADRLRLLRLEQVLPGNWPTLEFQAGLRGRRYCASSRDCRADPTLSAVAGFESCMSNDLIPLVWKP